jgi:2,4-dienoyl-CoA reductase-like NADH-dependent reductase (Old Yellow Enzyme family)
MSFSSEIGSRLFRSATFEGMADEKGIPTEDYLALYRGLAQNGVQNIITGCTFVSQEGKMVQPGQSGIDDNSLIPYYQKVTESVHQYGSKIYLQISHAGRQTSTKVTGKQVVGASDKRSPYFQSKPKMLSAHQIEKIIESYALAALRAKLAGFDGIQIHAAHGYLLHQFLHPHINNRTDEYGLNPDTGICELFLSKVIAAIKDKCGENYPILVKVSATDDLPKPFSMKNFIALIELLNRERVSAIEISYGTMENALNIFRGSSIPTDAILRHNFRYQTDNKLNKLVWKWGILPVLKSRIKGFTENYNLRYAVLAKQRTDIPIICVGGFRRGKDIVNTLNSGKTDYISLCRPLLCEPDFINRLCRETGYISKCVNCNVCAIMCDSNHPTRCYKQQ